MTTTVLERAERTALVMCTVCAESIRPEQEFVYVCEPDADFDTVRYRHAHYICVESCVEEQPV